MTPETRKRLQNMAQLLESLGHTPETNPTLAELRRMLAEPDGDAEIAAALRACEEARAAFAGSIFEPWMRLVEAVAKKVSGA